jgi:hypothetical protein
MPSATYGQVLRLARTLTNSERLRLIADLAGMAGETDAEGDESRSWLDLEGTLPYPALGEDAQAWVSRSRQESDEAREAQLRKGW